MCTFISTQMQQFRCHTSHQKCFIFSFFCEHSASKQKVLYAVILIHVVSGGKALPSVSDIKNNTASFHRKLAIGQFIASKDQLISRAFASVCFPCVRSEKLITDSATLKQQDGTDSLQKEQDGSDSLQKQQDGSLQKEQNGSGSLQKQQYGSDSLFLSVHSALTPQQTRTDSHKEAVHGPTYHLGGSAGRDQVCLRDTALERLLPDGLLQRVYLLRRLLMRCKGEPHVLTRLIPSNQPNHAINNFSVPDTFVTQAVGLFLQIRNKFVILQKQIYNCWGLTAHKLPMLQGVPKPHPVGRDMGDQINLFRGSVGT